MDSVRRVRKWEKAVDFVSRGNVYDRQREVYPTWVTQVARLYASTAGCAWNRCAPVPRAGQRANERQANGKLLPARETLSCACTKRTWSQSCTAECTRTDRQDGFRFLHPRVLFFPSVWLELCLAQLSQRAQLPLLPQFDPALKKHFHASRF